jgi:hypothetical protein
MYKQTVAFSDCYSLHFRTAFVPELRENACDVIFNDNPPVGVEVSQMQE